MLKFLLQQMCTYITKWHSCIYLFPDSKIVNLAEALCFREFQLSLKSVHKILSRIYYAVDTLSRILHDVDAYCHAVSLWNKIS